MLLSKENFILFIFLAVGNCIDGQNSTKDFPIIEAFIGRQNEAEKVAETTIETKGSCKLSRSEKVTKLLEIPNTNDPLGNFTLVCRAHYPVQWGFRLYQQWTPWSTSTRRIITNSSQETFETSLNFPQLRSIVQIRDNYPTCYRSNDIETQTSVRVGRRKPQLKTVYGSKRDLQPQSDFGKNSNCSLVLSYGPESGAFYCEFNDSDGKKPNITIFPRTCANPVECSKVYQGQQENCSSAIPSVSLEGCKQRDGCVKLTYTNNYLPSVAVCLVRGMPGELALESSVAIPFFYSVQPGYDGKPIRYISWNDVDPRKMLKISRLPFPLLVGQSFSFRCNASYYYFSAGLRLSLKTHYPSNPSSDPFDTIESVVSETTTGQEGQLLEMPYLHSLSVSNHRILAPGTYEIVCSAPVWNSTEWVAKSSGIFTVSEPRASDSTYIF